MKYGTDNSENLAILKDKVKEIFFRFSFKKYKLRKWLQQANSIEEKHSVCNQCLGVHQSKFEITALLHLIHKRGLKPQIICEIGTANGGTNLLLASSISSVTTVIGIDLYVKNKNKIRFFLDNRKTHFINGSSYKASTLERVKEILKGKRIDLLFIDGDHRYEGVKSDYEIYEPLVSNGGLICFHDIMPDYLTRHNRYTGMWAGDVPKYWNEIKLHHSHEEIVENYNQDGQGIGIIFNKV
jgi:cephalosporin hydroxylase